MNATWKHVLAGGLAACLLALAQGVAAQELRKPLLLVASPQLQGLYNQTALVAIPAGDKHLGFILNRATDKHLAELFPGHLPSAKVIDPVYFGGPEMVEAIFAIVRSQPGGRGIPLFGDLFMVVDADAVDRIIEQTPNDARYFAGYVGWQDGELQKEIENGFWFATDADPGLFFQPDTSKLWEDLVRRLGNGHPPQQGASFQRTRF